MSQYLKSTSIKDLLTRYRKEVDTLRNNLIVRRQLRRRQSKLIQHLKYEHASFATVSIPGYKSHSWAPIRVLSPTSPPASRPRGLRIPLTYRMYVYWRPCILSWHLSIFLGLIVPTYLYRWCSTSWRIRIRAQRIRSEVKWMEKHSTVCCQSSWVQWDQGDARVSWNKCQTGNKFSITMEITETVIAAMEGRIRAFVVHTVSLGPLSI